jgi:hypothetical protein
VIAGFESLQRSFQISSREERWKMIKPQRAQGYTEVKEALKPAFVAGLKVAAKAVPFLKPIFEAKR